ncbi:MAG: Fis family transcriptional regulator [Betaproteobacteria bacterium]|jgi:Fis family transcriptional regulator|nr:Fis family transcriptional regulator [Betaproteobacteria bacterium]MDE2122712.1 Fis family transcriptional regulator [Betaproteobacteria bacterium]MDE2186737.1 Fis family transcriptional regulator [Betaproteobacteria bacterium]MDE2323889.1 Fis family transcriptional regulator [Betaproteobacteria bacterium]NNM64144.1 Fis family transcriptional regulator [Burkholderiales bacterium]
MSKKSSLEQCVIDSLDAYFDDLNGTEPHGIHAMVMQTVEKPLLQSVMRRTQDNQSLAADWLGINRNTLRKKLKDHKLI